jgi:hypothetical protein
MQRDGEVSGSSLPLLETVPESSSHPLLEVVPECSSWDVAALRGALPSSAPSLPLLPECDSWDMPGLLDAVPSSAREQGLAAQQPSSSAWELPAASALAAGPSPVGQGRKSLFHLFAESVLQSVLAAGKPTSRVVAATVQALWMSQHPPTEGSVVLRDSQGLLLFCKRSGQRRLQGASLDSKEEIRAERLRRWKALPIEERARWALKSARFPVGSLFQLDRY